MLNSLKKIFHIFRRQLAKFWLKFFPKLIIIGITGSYGKTNTVQAIEAVLKTKFQTLTTDINLDTIYNLPLTLLKIRPKTKVLILEYGVDHKGEMDKHLALVKPQIGVITGITPVHSEKNLLGSLEGIIKEKSKLIEKLTQKGWAILNFDNQYVRKMAQKTVASIISYGNKPQFNYWASDIKVNLKGTSFLLHYNEVGKKQIKAIKTKLIGKHFVHEIMTALAVGKILGVDINHGAQGINNLKPLSGRMSIEEGPLETILLNDSLRANPESTIAGLETLAAIKHSSKKIAVLGEMGELGNYCQKEHYRVGTVFAKLNIDFLITIGSDTKWIIKGAKDRRFPKKEIFYAENVREAALFLKETLKPNNLWYLKGSRLKHLERILLILEGKRVDCQLTSCHNYWSCQNCPKLVKE
ncbi:hypothetical protein COT63_01360 [Candidatus Shapirobacteria bacterium CG09_land_8_20_14_0_10_38_17]|uniref:UDP-N-acetylmuramoyl-tripeptide--D-alanyl-D-alanine ligase n=1 Tax=Candidatus Shapirobacteria bacterium CG09_land_8_20_14_0_10_38_17 TaxID=1974884 RepID=A0A2H0WTF4_9BACT|nr:MAG: hypothetical protein COT63_01360 [Candidatus Shapirobacteria bacterium CG09_land_8_20_14_0_10_38_17]